ncbi:MAG: hypothetical protein IJI44_04020 [Erysipelotrichaceae bacterium]|nr:hypothetical protein [Erysipelotrichaceae bacterium]
MNKETSYSGRKRIIGLLFILFVLVVYAIFGKNEQPSPTSSSRPTDSAKKNDTGKTDTTSKPKNTSDPLSLSFTDSSLLFDSDLRNRLSGSVLEYCSHVIETDDSSDLILTWNLKSDGREVYRCEYSFDRNRKYSERSKTACELGEAYQDYLNGDKQLIRDYVMPKEGDDIDMFVYENGSSYYEKYFILGKYSDMECYVKGDDIYFTYYWYQDTEEGPRLVYKSTAKNTDTTSGKRYSEDLWELYEESCRNIHIISYEQYPRDYDYYEVYREWDDRQHGRIQEENLREEKELYCACSDAQDLYEEYSGEFDDYEEAENYWDQNCE